MRPRTSLSLPAADRGSSHPPHATLLSVIRHIAPTIVEATVIPTVLFYAAWMTLGHRWGYAVALVWAYSALVRHLRTGTRVPGILVLALIGLTIRTALAMATGNSFFYFAQPILATTLVALLFLGSAATKRPFVARLAGDFFPMTVEVAARPRIRQLFRRLTLLWAGVNLLNAAAGASLLLTLPTAIFIPTKTAAALTITVTGTVVTVLWSLRVARHEGLVGTHTVVAVTA
jgi:intracellular septation protein A